MLKYTVTSKNAQGQVLFSDKIEGKVFAENAYLVQLARADVKSVKMTRYVVAFGTTETIKAKIK